MLGAYLSLLMKFARQPRSAAAKLFALVAGGAFFLILLPFMLMLIARPLAGFIPITWPAWSTLFTCILSAPLGLFIILWTTSAQWYRGRGTPAPVAPTTTLIVTGPYRLCRNPIELGAILYYLGLTSFLGGLSTGLCTALLTLIFASIYHKFVEEKELEERFGAAYIQYRENTPFLIPRLRRRG